MLEQGGLLSDAAAMHSYRPLYKWKKKKKLKLFYISPPFFLRFPHLQQNAI